MKKFILRIIVLIVLVAGGFYYINHLNHAVNDMKAGVATTTNKKAANGNFTATLSSPCSGNTLAEVIIVGIAQQHLWACAFSTTAYSSPVITGYSGLAADITPTGNYRIYSKETNVTLSGTDGVTTWHDPVSYWMPFLFNQYGAYGFHDATWRTPEQFGNISPTSSTASHGCVELPLATAHWLYDWSSVGTQIQIKQSA